MKRYFIKVYPMHEQEIAACQAAAIEDPEFSDGLVQGIADEETIQFLSGRGLVVQAVSEISAPPDGDRTKFRDISKATRPASSELRGGKPHPAIVSPPAERPLPLDEPDQPYLLVNLLSGLSDRTIAQLKNAGGEIIERDPSGYFVVRALRGASPIQALPFVADVRTYGAAITLAGTHELGVANEKLSYGRASASLRSTAQENRDVGRSGLYEAILHRTEDKDAVLKQLDELGVSVVSVSARVVKFVPKSASLDQIADLAGVSSLAKTRHARLFHDHARPLIGLDSGTPRTPTLPYTGLGEIVGVADTGLDETHPDFQERIIAVVPLGRAGDASDPDGHGTHVAGSILGDGSGSNHSLLGAAPQAQLYFQSVLDANGGLGGLPDALEDLFAPAYANGVRVHNNSWGAYLQSRYDSMAIEVDDFVWRHPDFLPVIAAGNEGSCRPHQHAKSGFVDYPSLGSPATAKNGLTVGASRSSRDKNGMAELKWGAAWPADFDKNPIKGEFISGDDQCLAAFSSRGPCEDMRIKPDIVAPGTDIASTRSRAAPLAHFWGAYPRNPLYAFMGGTSMACPIVAGCAAVTRQFYREAKHYPDPSAALLKATLINGTTELSGSDATAPLEGFPNYHQGFGRINMTKSLPDPAEPAFDLEFIDTWKCDPALRFEQRQGRRRWRITLRDAGEMRICLVWTDPPAKGLQNSLRMILDDVTGTKWIANARAAAPIRFSVHDPRNVLPGNDRVITRDPQNNVQVIRDQFSAGPYTLAIFADSLLRLPQDFALVVAGPTGFSMELI